MELCDVGLTTAWQLPDRILDSNLETDRVELDPDSQEMDLESEVKLQFVATRMNEENKYFRKLAKVKIL